MFEDYPLFQTFGVDGSTGVVSGIPDGIVHQIEIIKFLSHHIFGGQKFLDLLFRPFCCLRCLRLILESLIIEI